MSTVLEIYYMVSNHIYFAYTKKPHSNTYDWDDFKYTKDEFFKKYKDYKKIKIKEKL